MLIKLLFLAEKSCNVVNMFVGVAPFFVRRQFAVLFSIFGNSECDG